MKHSRHALIVIIAVLYSFMSFKVYRGLPLHLSISTIHKPWPLRMSGWSKGKGSWEGIPVKLNDMGSIPGKETFFFHMVGSTPGTETFFFTW